MKKLLLILSLLLVSSAFAETVMRCKSGPELVISNENKITVRMGKVAPTWIFVKYEQAFFFQRFTNGGGTGEFPNKVQGDFSLTDTQYSSYIFNLVRYIPGKPTLVIKQIVDAPTNRIKSEEKITCEAFER